MVTVAQLVESRIVIPVVVGSSPIGHPKIAGPNVVAQAFFLSVRLVFITVDDQSMARFSPKGSPLAE